LMKNSAVAPPRKKPEVLNGAADKEDE